MLQRAILALAICLITFSVEAQNRDSLAFVAAQRKELSLPDGAEGYTIKRVEIFSSVQTISVIRYSPKRFSTHIVLPEELSPLSVVANKHNADFGVNAGYWDVKIDLPSTFLRIDGKSIAQTAGFEEERVDGVVCLAKRKVVIDACKVGREGEYVAKYDNILASGPVLIDDGKSVDHKTYMDAMVSPEHGQPIGAYYTYYRRHPRTVIGTDKRGSVYLVVVDGRLEGNADGMTITELTTLCEWLGLQEAINLDGGSSSTMWSREEGVINHPCKNRRFDHAGERDVSSVIIVKGR